MTLRRVVLGVPAWGESGPCAYVETLAGALTRLGFDSRILITQPSADAILPPNQVKLHVLPRAPLDRQADVWLALIRYLEENAPCVYLSNQDWVAASIAPRLSNRVQVIGVLHEDRAEEYETCARLGKFWNAIVVLNPSLRQHVMSEYPELSARLSSIGMAEHDNGARPGVDAAAAQYADLFERCSGWIRSGRYRRTVEKMTGPPDELVPWMSHRELSSEAARVNAIPAWPDVPSPQPVAEFSRITARPLTDYRIVISVPTGRVSGVDVFSIGLARGLIQRGISAELVQTSPDARVADRMTLPGDVPLGRLTMKQYPTWRNRWTAMREYLEARAPCIYLPNYDNQHSSIVPTLSSSVKVVGIAHSDDAQHYSHIVHLSRYWDAVVGVSRQVSTTLAELLPEIESRLATIPYGTFIPPELPPRKDRAGRRFTAVYTGRVVRFQKRAMDLISIANELDERGSDTEITIAGSGAELIEALSAGSGMAVSRRLRFVGSVANDDIPQLLQNSDVFILPSSFEGLPVSLLEAMANGCVPIVTDVRSGVPEIIRDGVNGFVVPVGAVSQIAERLMELERDPALVERMRSAAYETVRERFAIERMTSDYVRVFEKIVSEPYLRPRGKLLPPPEMHPLEVIMPRFPMPMRRLAWKLMGRR